MFILPLALLLPTTALSQSLSPSCSPPLLGQSCTFYSSCLEPLYHCGTDGYPIGYGLHYCDRFISTLPSIPPATTTISSQARWHAELDDILDPSWSAEGIEWVHKTLSCLQYSLLPRVIYPSQSPSNDTTTTTTLSCSALKSYAFNTHPKCYVQSGVCELSAPDWELIVRTVGLENAFSWQAFVTLWMCLKQWFE